MMSFLYFICSDCYKNSDLCAIKVYISETVNEYISSMLTHVMVLAVLRDQLKSEI